MLLEVREGWGWIPVGLLATGPMTGPIVWLKVGAFCAGLGMLRLQVDSGMLVVQPLAGFGSGAMFIASEVFIDPRLVTEISTLLGFSPASFGLAVAGSCPLLSSVNKPLLSPLKAFAGISLGFC